MNNAYWAGILDTLVSDDAIAGLRPGLPAIENLSTPNLLSWKEGAVLAEGSCLC